MESIVSERKNVFYHNLLCLGSTNVDFMKKYGVSLHRNMCATPNRAEFEAVSHFLFAVLSGVTNEEYSLPWPLVDQELRRTYLKTCFAHLTRFSEEGIVKFPRITLSFLSMHGGERITEIFLAFSTYVLVKKLRKDGVKFLNRSVATKENFQAAKTVLQLSTINHVANFREGQILTGACTSSWIKISKNLSDCLEELKKLIPLTKESFTADLRLIKECLNVTPDESLSFKCMVQKIHQTQLKPVQSEMNKLKEFLAKEERLWNSVESVVGSDSQDEVLDFGELDISQLNRNCDQVSAEDGKLTAVKYLKMLLGCLKSITSGLEAADLGRLHESCSVPNSIEVKEYHDNVVKMLERLMNVDLPSINENILALKRTVGFDDISSEANLIVPVLPEIPLRDFKIERLANYEPGELLSAALSSSDSAPDLFNFL